MSASPFGPDTTIDSGPAGPTNDATPTFAFSSASGVAFQCRVDGAAFAGCTSPFTSAPLADGPHTFDVRALDATGAADQTPASRSFTVDTSAPAVTIDSGPSGVTDTPAPVFAWSSAPGTTFSCRIDGGDFTPCTSPYTAPPLGPGPHTFELRAVDAAGNAGSASRSFTVATPQPQPSPSPSPSPTPSATPAPTPAPPVFHSSVVVTPVSGTIRIKKPGSNDFVDLPAGANVPLGSTLDTKQGVITLAAVPKPGAPPQTARFYDGIFTVTQTGATTDLTLVEALAPCARRSASAAAAKPKKRKLWGDGSGSFRTVGRYSAATVRGTTWLVTDSCQGTLTQVRRGVVAVRDNVRGRTITLRAGKHYLARPR